MENTLEFTNRKELQEEISKRMTFQLGPLWLGEIKLVIQLQENWYVLKTFHYVNGTPKDEGLVNPIHIKEHIAFRLYSDMVWFVKNADPFDEYRLDVKDLKPLSEIKGYYYVNKDYFKSLKKM